MKGVYFITFKSECDYVKIGVTKDLNQRLKQMSVHTPYHIDVLAFSEVLHDGIEGLDLRVALESNYHRDLEEYHHQGEWFHLSGEVLDLIDYINEEGSFEPFTFIRQSTLDRESTTDRPVSSTTSAHIA